MSENIGINPEDIYMDSTSLGISGIGIKSCPNATDFIVSLPDGRHLSAIDILNRLAALEEEVSELRATTDFKL